jgi:TonB family protein
MNEKVLNLVLNYMGKNLNIVKYQRDFKKKFLIGSNKHLLWQILDPSFPDKFVLVECAGQNYVLNLRQGMDVKVKKGDKVLDAEALKQEKLIHDNKLILSADTSGSISFSKNWEISYEFKAPSVIVLTEEEKKIVKQYAHRTPLTPETRFSQLIMVAGIVLTTGAMFVFNQLYKPPVLVDNTLEGILVASRKMAQYVTPDVTTIVNKETQKTVETTDIAQSEETRALAETVARVIAVTTERDLVAEGIGGGGYGTGGNLGATGEALEQTTTALNPKAVNVAGLREVGHTPRFVAYEDPPVVVSKVIPEYTQFARRANIQGTVWLDVEILVDGHVGAVNVKKSLDSSPNGLDDAAVNAVKKWKFQPAKSSGKPVACWATIPVVFSLSQ